SWGANGGLGVTARGGGAPYRVYAESRYHYAPFKNINARVLTVTFGIRYLPRPPPATQLFSPVRHLLWSEHFPQFNIFLDFPTKEESMRGFAMSALVAFLLAGALGTMSTAQPGAPPGTMLGVLAGNDWSVVPQWQGSGLPYGSYQQTCRNIRNNGYRLDA